MGNPEHLEILKQGVDVWNKWRAENPIIQPDLTDADLAEADLRGFNFGIQTRHSFKSSVIVISQGPPVKLIKSNLQRANLQNVSLEAAYLFQANLSESNLRRTDLRWANLSKTKLCDSSLGQSLLNNANLNGADLSGAEIYDTVFGFNDLSSVIGLNEVIHRGPSNLDIHSIYRSKRKIPASFLRGCGLPESLIDYTLSLTDKALEYYSCFISYSSKDQDFVERLHADLQNKGVRCWFAPEDMKIGDKIRQSIDQSIRSHDKLLLILSENSIKSNWVEDECETAYEREIREHKTVLFPVRIDDAVMDTNMAWASKLRRSRNIGDFTQWKDHDEYQNAFERLLRDLEAESW